MLTEAQKQAAKALLDIRPPVIEGTRVIVDDKLCKEWNDKVCAAQIEHGLTDNIDDWWEFCDIAGVPD
jgi:hypothetical protein